MITIKHEIETINWEIKRGDTYNTQFLITDDEDRAVDLTGFTITGDARENTRSAKLFALPITILDQTVPDNQGWVEILLSDTFTNSLGSAGRPTSFKYDVQVEYPSNGGTFTIIEGKFEVFDDYTRAGNL